MSRLLLLTPRRRSLVAAANNANLPINYNNSSNWVHNDWTAHTSGPRTYRNLEVTFVNGIISTNAEVDAGYDFFHRCALFLNGVFHQGVCNGSTQVTVAKSWGRATYTFPTLTSLPPNTTFFITSYRAATDGGVAGSYNVITNTGNIIQRQDGQIAGTDPSKDYTLGVGVAYGAANARVTGAQISSGGVTAVTRSAAGQGYSAGLNLGPWYGPAGAGKPGSLIPGSGIVGYGNFSGGQYTDTTILDGGVGHSAANPPYIYLGGSNTAASGFGLPTACYGPSLIAGTPDASTPSLLIHGDSIPAGYGSVDSTGDLKANYGAYEQRLANAYGLFKLAVGGESAAGWVANNTKQLAFVDAMRARGLSISTVILALGVNDFLTNTFPDVKTVTQANVTAIADIWRARGAKVIMTTIPPATTSTDNFVTTANQTAYNANYTANSYVDQYNSELLGGTGPANDGVIDIRAACQAAAAPTKWRVDAFGAGNAFTGDGIHPSQGTGIPYLTANLSIPALT